MIFVPVKDLNIVPIKCWQTVNLFNKTCKEVISFLKAASKTHMGNFSWEMHIDTPLLTITKIA